MKKVKFMVLALFLVTGLVSVNAQKQQGSIFSIASKQVKLTTIDTMVEYGPTTGTLNGHDWVDLGLPSGTRWATCNVDATAPEKPGKHYSWGETATKSQYIAENTKTYNKVMDDIAGDATYDVAAQKWGSGWRMPTEMELRELLNYSNDEYVQKGGRWGREFTSVINNKSIFLPATGSIDGAKLKEANGCGLYWTSTPLTNNFNNGAHMYTFGAALGEPSIGERSSGFAVRPVTDYDVNTAIPSDGETNGHKWVDLGLPSGLKWATCNLGTDEVDQDGGYYRWGAITTYYESKNYAKDDVQRDITSDANYDAAAALWGGGWHMPTVQDFAELMDHCTWEWTNIGRRKGLKVTSKHNGKYIFLPASGAMDYSCDASRLPDDVNKWLNYWTSSDIPGQNTSEAYYLSALEEQVYFRTNVRWSYGYCIRPVIK
ncbi:MAG: hypothetical protein UFP03_06385 [Paludibacteraceae bacterium]|nr:hypothetical protein [Paludibacteraceae bacterium]